MENEFSYFEKLMSPTGIFPYLLALFLIALTIQLYFYLRYFLNLAKYQEQANKNLDVGVSVIIAAQNEKKYLEEYLKLILNQNHRVFEVIVINNNSTDGTLDYLSSIKHERLRVLDCKEEGKKAAIQQGIDAAKYGNLLFTDADCQPASEQWLSLMTSQLNSEYEIVLGFGAFFKENTLLNRIIRFESLLNAMQYFSFAINGNAYMGVGRNLAYQKSIYKKSTVFKTHQKIKSGDDDLVVNEMATAKNVSVCLSSEGHTLTWGEQSWLKYYRQKRRQLQAGNFYKGKHRRLLAYFGASNVLYYALFVILLCKGELTYYILGIFAVKQILEYLLFYGLCKKLKSRNLVKWIPILEPIYLVIITVIGVSTWFWNVEKWK